MENNNSKLLTINDYTGELVDQAAKEILNYSPQLYRKYNNVQPIKPEPWASAILLKINTTKFLLTAGHVLLENDNEINPEDIGVMIEKTFFILNGDLKYLKPSDSKINNNLDYAVWRLDNDVAEDLGEKYKFLELSDVEVDHIVTSEPKYLIVGFPVTQSKLNPITEKIKVDPFIFLTNEAKKNLYKRLDLEEDLNILLNYRKAKIKSFDTKLAGQGPDTYGVSGSGLWYLPSLVIKKGEYVPFRLVGIMIEWRRNQSVLIATRIHRVIEIIKRKFKLA